MVIHTLRDYNNNAASSSTPARSSNIGGIGGRQIATLGNTSSNSSLSSPSAPYNAYEPQKLGISLVRPPLHEDGSLPSWPERCCPRVAWMTATTVLSFIDLIMFIITLIVAGQLYGDVFVSDNDMGGPSAQALYGMGAKWEPDIRKGYVYRLLIPIILHAGILHILTNVIFQMRFGYTCEVRWTTTKFLIIYFLTGISASLWSCVLGPHDVSVGASGAIFGIVGADAAYLAYNFIEIPDAKQETFFLAIILVLNFLFGLSGVGIDNWAHLGGLVSGVFAGLWLTTPLVKRETENYWRYGAGAIFWIQVLIFILCLWVGSPWPYGEQHCVGTTVC